MMKLFKSLVVSRAGDDAVTYWDFVTNYEWVSGGWLLVGCGAGTACFTRSRWFGA